jgi:hypothetical protein
MFYRCSVYVREFDRTRKDKIFEAIQSYWHFEEPHIFEYDTDDAERLIDVEGEANLGNEERAFAEKLSILIWKANNNKCKVTVNMTCLEDLPTESYCFDDSNYVEIMAKA